MTITVQVSDFRNNMAMYLGKLDAGHEIKLMKGKISKGKIIPDIKNKKTINMAANILSDMDKVRKKIGLKSEAKSMDELNNEIDRIVYGVDRNGKELSR
jgi:hypothetical protein